MIEKIVKNVLIIVKPAHHWMEVVISNVILVLLLVMVNLYWIGVYLKMTIVLVIQIIFPDIMKLITQLKV